MTVKDQQEFKKLIKEGTLEALSSKDGQDAVVNALRSKGGQDAIVDAMNSMDGQEAIKTGSLAALKSEEGKEILIDNFVEGFHEVVVPILDDHGVRIKRMERKMEGVAI